MHIALIIISILGFLFELFCLKFFYGRKFLLISFAVKGKFDVIFSNIVRSHLGWRGNEAFLIRM